MAKSVKVKGHGRRPPSRPAKKTPGPGPKTVKVTPHGRRPPKK